jgi:hypothetical protein
MILQQANGYYQLLLCHSLQRSVIVSGIVQLSLLNGRFLFVKLGSSSCPSHLGEGSSTQSRLKEGALLKARNLNGSNHCSRTIGNK